MICHLICPGDPGIELCHPIADLGWAVSLKRVLWWAVIIQLHVILCWILITERTVSCRYVHGPSCWSPPLYTPVPFGVLVQSLDDCPDTDRSTRSGLDALFPGLSIDSSHTHNTTHTCYSASGSWREREKVLQTPHAIACLDYMQWPSRWRAIERRPFDQINTALIIGRLQFRTWDESAGICKLASSRRCIWRRL